jgi:hypothetical protein
MDAGFVRLAGHAFIADHDSGLSEPIRPPASGGGHE